jgi:hypothetical protein
MSKLILAVTATTNPQGYKTTASQTIVVESDKITVFPREGTDKALVIANGYSFEVDAEVAEIASAMSAADASSYT